MNLKSLKDKLFSSLKKFFKGESFAINPDIILYLCGNEALPSPLDSETELDLILEAEKEVKTPKTN